MAKRQSLPTEERDQQVLRRLSNIEHKVDSIEQTTAFALRANETGYVDAVKKIFKHSRRRAQVYLAANAHRGVQEIANLIGIDQPNVTRELKYLQEDAMVEVIEKESGKTYWGKTPLDKTLKITRFLMDEFQLDKDGLPIK